jgi:hypothetical protein
MAQVSVKGLVDVQWYLLGNCLYVIIRVLWAKRVSATEIDRPVR